MTSINQQTSLHNTLSSALRIDLQQQLLARHMLLSGYVTHIVQIETGLPPKKVRHIMKSLIEEGYPDEKRSRASRSSKTLMCNQITKLHASMLMQIYLKYGGEKIMTSIDISALTYAYRTYVSIFNHQPSGHNLLPRDGLFEISDAWFLAKELRSQDAVFEKCPDCDCSFFTATNQGTLIRCPFCHDGKTVSMYAGKEAIHDE